MDQEARKPITKAWVVKSIEQGRDEWEAVLKEVGRERMEQPGVEGDWTIKDIVAHNMWNEREMVRMVSDHALLPSESDRLWQMSNDERNAELYRMFKDRPLDELLDEDLRVHRQLMEAMEDLDNTDMVDQGRFPGMPDDWVPWEIIAGCTFNHYPDHVRDIRAWLESTKARA